MREIKFRSWDKLSKKMSNPYNLQRQPTFNSEYEGQFCISTIKPSGWLGFDSLSENERQIALQYTGFKDAINKSEVYEHDIINFLGVGFLKVEWDYKDTGWICLDKRYKKRSLVDVLLSGGIKVGNIYETPELLGV